MNLLCVLAAILALTLAEEENRIVQKIENINDSTAEAPNAVLLRSGADFGKSASYGNPSYIAEQFEAPQPVQPANAYVQSVQPEVQKNYNWFHTGVIKNDVYYGDHGDYGYEYQLVDGTHVSEQGWFTDPRHTDESLVKKGWYSWVAADGVRYTVTWWADHTGYHAHTSHTTYPNWPQYYSLTPTSYTVEPTTTRPVKPSYPVYTTPPEIYYPIDQRSAQQLPTYDQLQQIPAYTQPQQLPAYNQPQQLPAQNQPQQLPAYNQPQQLPAYNQPQQHIMQPNYKG